MFHLSSRSLYALSAIYELAYHEKHSPKRPIKIAAIARKQRIPTRFLEGILAHLKRGGFVKSRRGVEGGYQLNRRAKHLTIGEVMFFLEGPLDFSSSRKKGEKDSESGALDPLHRFWKKLEGSIERVINKVTFGDLVEENETKDLSYVI